MAARVVREAIVPHQLIPELAVVRHQAALQELQRHTLAVVVVVVAQTRLAVVVVRGKELQAQTAAQTALQIQVVVVEAILMPLVLAAVEL